MKLVEVNRIPTKKSSPCSDIFYEFLESGLKRAEIIEWEGEVSDISTVYKTLDTIIRRKYQKICRVSMRGNRVFLERLDTSAGRSE